MKYFLRNALWLFTLKFCVTQLLNGQPSQALIDSQIVALSKAKEDTNKVNLLATLGNDIEYSDFNKAEAYGLEALTLSKRLHFLRGELRATYLLGNVYIDKGEYEKAKSYLERAERLADSLGNRSFQGFVNNAYATLYYIQGDNWNAAYRMEKAISAFKYLKDSVREASIILNLVSVLSVLKNHDRAIELSKKLIPFFEKQNDSTRVALCMHQLIYNYNEQDRPLDGRQYVSPLLQFAEVTRDKNMKAESYKTLSGYYLETKENAKALEYSLKSIEASSSNQYNLSAYYTNAALAYLRLNQLEQSKEYFDKAENISIKSSAADIAYSDLWRSEYYEKTGNYKEVVRLLRTFNKWVDSTLTAETRQYATHLEAVYENNKKENEILRLKTVELEKTLALKQRNNFLYAAAGFALLLSMIILFQLRNHKNKRKLMEQDKLLQEEKINTLEKQQQVISLQSMITGQETERGRIAKDLHDGLGGLFSTVKMYFSSLQHERPELATDPLFSKSYELADTASVELRRIAHNLMPEVLLKLGLINAVQDLCNNINIGRLLKISLQSYGMEKRLTNNTEVMLYRIIQELLNNIIKHSQATEVIIQFNKHSDRLTITIEDNGRGFNVDEATSSHNAGIGTIKSRVNFLNGQLNIDSKQGIGTTVIMEFLMGEEAAN